MSLKYFVLDWIKVERICVHFNKSIVQNQFDRTV